MNGNVVAAVAIVISVVLAMVLLADVFWEVHVRNRRARGKHERGRR